MQTENHYEEMVGKTVLVRTVTYFMLGKVVGTMGSFLAMDTTSWVADTGRLGEAIKTGSLGESEYVGDGVLVNLDAAVDVIPWAHELPTRTK
jgi:hypothetical protein